jgi:hypothetical protein
MNHPYSAKLTYRAKRGRWPSLRGELYERDVMIGRFSRGPVEDHFVPPIECQFLSDAARNRFDNFADCLSIEESIDALLAAAGPGVVGR